MNYIKPHHIRLVLPLALASTLLIQAQTSPPPDSQWHHFGEHYSYPSAPVTPGQTAPARSGYGSRSGFASAPANRQNDTPRRYTPASVNGAAQSNWETPPPYLPRFANGVTPADVWENPPAPVTTPAPPTPPYPSYSSLPAAPPQPAADNGRGQRALVECGFGAIIGEIGALIGAVFIDMIGGGGAMTVATLAGTAATGCVSGALHELWK